MFEIETEHIEGGFVWAVVLKLGPKRLILSSSPEGDIWDNELEAFEEGALALAFDLDNAIKAGKLITV